MTTRDPAEQHQEALDTVDRQIELAREVDLSQIGGDGTSWYSVAQLESPHQAAGAGLADFDARYIASLDPAKRIAELEGRKRILLRHGPRFDENGRSVCFVCADWGESDEALTHHGAFPCPDWRDAAGLPKEVPNGRR